MSAHAFAAWCEQTPTSVIIKESTWMFPAILVVHLIGLAWIGATVVAIDLRLIGAGLRGRSARDLSRDLRPWMWGGLALALGSGCILFASEALRCVDNPNRWRRFLLQQTKSFIEAVTVPEREYLSGHDLADFGVRSALFERPDDVVARQQTDRAAQPIHHRELALAGAQQRLRRGIDVLVGRQRDQFGHHRRSHWYALRYGADRNQMRLRSGGKVNEDGDEDQQRIAEQADKTEYERDCLTDRGRDFGGADITEPRRQ